MDFPIELQEKMLELHKSVENISSVMNTVMGKTAQETRDKLEPLERAKFDLVCAYVLNSLFWMYLNTKGENPHEHAVKQELERVQSYMTKVKQQMDKAKAPKLDVGSAKRMLRHSLWTPKERNDKTVPQTASDVEVIEEINTDGKGQKRAVHKNSKGSRKKHRKK